MIGTVMSGKAIDINLKAFNDAASADNSGKVLYIKDGQLAFEEGEALFDLAEWEDE